MKVPLTQARFLKSAATVQDFPADMGAEVAFCGRSNAGKSSTINALCGQNNLARTSKTPGRTQLINFFKLDGDSRLVDLPGYGYAKAPAKSATTMAKSNGVLFDSPAYIMWLNFINGYSTSAYRDRLENDSME